MSMTHFTTKDHPWSGLPPGTMSLSKSCMELVLALTGCSTQKSGPALCPSCTIELALVTWVQIDSPEILSAGELSLPPYLPCGCTERERSLLLNMSLIHI